MRFVVIGNGAAGNAAARAILRKASCADVTIISSERHPFYSRILTSYYIAGKTGYDGMFLEPAARDGRGVKVLLSTEVVGIDPGRRVVATTDGSEIPYDRLLIATGSTPVRLDAPGANLPGVFTLRTIDDAVAIRSWLDGQGTGAPALVLGGGMVGLKAAEALAAAGAVVTVAVASSSILSQVLDPDSASIVQEHLERGGIRFCIGEDAEALEGRDRVEAVRLRSGRSLPARTVVVGKGVRPSTDLVRGIPVGVNRGIVVNRFLETGVDGIYAAGDACEAYDPLRGRNAVNALWTTAVEQGRVAGGNMAGARVEYLGGIASNSFRFGAFCAISFGNLRGGGNARVGTWRRGTAYRRIVIEDGRIVGAVEIGPGRSMGVLRSLALRPAERRARAREHIESLAQAFLDGTMSFAHVSVRAGLGGAAGR